MHFTDIVTIVLAGFPVISNVSPTTHAISITNLKSCTYDSRSLPHLGYGQDTQAKYKQVSIYGSLQDGEEIDREYPRSLDKVT